MTIISTYYPDEVCAVAAYLRVDGASCSVVANRVDGDIDVKNSYKYVVIKGSAGSVRVQGNSSPIEVIDVKAAPPGSEFELITKYKPVKLTLPAETDAVVRAETQYGKIYSDFPVYLGVDPDKQVKIEQKKGKVLVKIKTTQDITIREK